VRSLVHRFSLLSGLVFLVSGAVEARAQEADEPPEVAERAREHFRKGLLHFHAREYREAIHEFELSAELVPSADLWFNIARAYQEIDEPAEAILYYERYLRDRADPPDRAKVEASIGVLKARAEEKRQASRHRPTTGTLRVASEIEGASIVIDGATVGTTPLPIPLRLEPGVHRLEVRKEGFITQKSDITVEAGVTTVTEVTLVPRTEYATVRRKRVATWITYGLAAGALGTSLGYGIAAYSANRDGDLDRSRDLGRVSDVALGTGIGLLLTGTVLYFVEGRPKSKQEASARRRTPLTLEF
jgi:tetratricopeptide (TPR) repeat protein